MEKILEQSLLYDFYGELLTEHQKSIYEDFVLNDLSLSEIAEEREISRQGVYDMVRRCNKLLEGYEQKLHLIEKFLAAKQKVGQIHELAAEMLSGGEAADNTPQHRAIERLAPQLKTIERLANEVMDEL